MPKGKELVKNHINHSDLINRRAAQNSHELDYEFFKNFPSQHTRLNYRNDIEQFLGFLREGFALIKSIEEIQRIHLVAYRNFLEENDYAPKTINRKFSAVSSYFDFLVEKGLHQFNPATSVRRPKQEVIAPTLDLSDEQVEALFATLEQSGPSAPLHKAIVYLFFATGIRKSELINLKRKDLKYYDNHAVIEVRAKGGKYLLKALHPDCMQVIEDYMHWMQTQGREIHPEDWLFQPTRNPLKPGELVRPMGAKSIDYIIKKYCKLAGLNHRISAHSARASYIGSALEAGVDLLKVSQDVGHASVRTTQEYNKRRMKIKESPTYNLGYFKKSS